MWLQKISLPFSTKGVVHNSNQGRCFFFSPYLGRQAENIPPLYHYPRLCIIQHDDHQHAAFYPPVEELQGLGTRIQTRLNQITSQQIIKFARDYLKDPTALIVKTEYF